ncbi:DCC1-like thiol-disulfide oxidoreductase family protein [Lacinutrix salivirga]
MRFLGFINRLYNKKISSKGLAVFRICFALNLFFEVFRIFRYRQLYFDPIPFIEESNFNYAIPLVLWMVVLLLLVFGVFTRWIAIANYGFAFFMLNGLNSFSYHMDYAYLGISFLLIFIPVSKSISIDNLREKLKYSNTKQLHNPIEKTSVLNYFLIIFAGVAIVYFDSIFTKIKCDTWINGLGMWLPASLPQITILNNQWLLNQEILIKGLGYLTFAFEIIFPFTFFIKRFRVLFLCIGLGLHLGILLEFPIPFFALGVAAIYMLMVPVKWWEKLTKAIQLKSPKLQFFYDAVCPLCVKTKIVVSHFDVFKAIQFKSVQEHAQTTQALQGIPTEVLLSDIYSVDKTNTVFSGVDTYKRVSRLVPLFYPIALLFFIPGVNYIANKIYNTIAKNRKTERCTEVSCGIPILVKTPQNSKYDSFNIIGVKVLFVAFLFLQLNTSFNFPISKPIVTYANKNFDNSEAITSKVAYIKGVLMLFSGKFLGVVTHGVFVDSHFKGYETVFTLKHNGKLLPLFDENGMPDTYLKSGTWLNFTFRSNNSQVLDNLGKLEKGLIKFSAFYAYKNKVDLKDSNFQIVKRNVKSTFKWEKDLLKNNRAMPWEAVGTLIWKNNTPEIVLNLEE